MDIQGATWTWVTGKSPYDEGTYLGEWVLIHQNRLLAKIKGYDSAAYQRWDINLASGVGPPAPHGRGVQFVTFPDYTDADVAKAATERYLEDLITPALFMEEGF